MPTIRIKDLTTDASLADSDVFPTDGPDGTRGMTAATLKTGLASAFVAAPTTYKLATLDGSDKVLLAQMPNTLAGAIVYKGVVAGASVPATSPSAGDYYIITSAGTSQSVTWAIGDMALYRGTSGNWDKVTEGTTAVAQGGTGATTAATARTNLGVLSGDQVRGKNAAFAPHRGMWFATDSTQRIDGAATNSLLALGTRDFSVTWSCAYKAPLVNSDLFHTHISGNNRFVVRFQTNGVIRIVWFDAVSAQTTYDLTPDVPLVDGDTYHFCVTFDRDGLATLYVNGVGDRDGSGGGVTVSIAAVSSTDVGSGNTNKYIVGYTYEALYFTLRVFNRLLTEAQALTLAKCGIQNDDQWGSLTVLASGLLTIGKRYKIVTRTDGDFVAVGAADNNVGTEFIATGTGGGTLLDAGDTALSIGAIFDLDMDGGDPVASLTVRDMSNSANDGTATATGVNQLVRTGTVHCKALSVGGTATIKRILTASVVLDFPNAIAQNPVTLTATVTGAAPGDIVLANSLGVPNLSLLLDGYVSAADTVTLKASNFTASGANWPSDTFRIIVIQI